MGPTLFFIEWCTDVTDAVLRRPRASIVCAVCSPSSSTPPMHAKVAPSNPSLVWPGLRRSGSQQDLHPCQVTD